MTVFTQEKTERVAPPRAWTVEMVKATTGERDSASALARASALLRTLWRCLSRLLESPQNYLNLVKAALGSRENKLGRHLADIT